MITKQYYVRVDYVPDSDERGRIKYFDEVIDKVMSIDNRICHTGHTYASDAYYDCVVDSLKEAESIEKTIEAILTSYKYRII